MYMSPYFVCRANYKWTGERVKSHMINILSTLVIVLAQLGYGFNWQFQEARF